MRMLLGQGACAWRAWEQAASSSAQESWAKSCSLVPRKALGFGCMDKLPRDTSCVRVGSLHSAAALWRDQGKVSECFLKSCGCLSVVSGSGSAIELGVRSSLFLCSSVYARRFCSMKLVCFTKLPVSFLLYWGFHVSGPVALLSHVRIAALLAW